MQQYVSVAVVGLIVGIVAIFILFTNPGAVPIGLIGLIKIIILGIAGSLLAGFVGGIIHKPTDGQAFHPAGFADSLICALAIIFIARYVLHLV